MSKIQITYRKSAIGYSKDQKATLVALGLKKLNQTVEQELTPSLAGQVRKVRHLVSVNGEPADSVAGMAVLHLEQTSAGAAS